MPENGQFRAIATAMLDRRIRNMRRLNDMAWIDTSLITHAEYQLFLDMMYAQGKYYQPDHWKDKRFPPGEAQSFAVGMRPSDAIAFCAWLSEQGWGIFRLPIEEETNEMEDKVPGFWQFTHEGEGETKYKGAKPVLAYTLDQKRVLEGTLDLALALDVDINRALALTLDLDLDLDHAVALTRTLDFTLDLAIEQARDLALALNIELDEAPTLAQTLDHVLFRPHTLTHILARTRVLIRALILDRSLNTNKEILMIVSVYLSILSLRREGLLPAFEGILIVREEP